MGRAASERRRTEPDHSASATVSTPSGPGALACFSAQPRSERPGASSFTEAVLTPTRPDVILLVEDDDTLRQRVLNSLEREEYWVLCARDGEEAWNLFSEHLPLIRLVMTEVVLPGMDGLERAAWVRHHSPDLRILYMASEDQTVRRRASGCGEYPQLVPDEALRSRVPPLEGTGGVEGLNGCLLERHTPHESGMPVTRSQDVRSSSLPGRRGALSVRPARRPGCRISDR